MFAADGSNRPSLAQCRPHLIFRMDVHVLGLRGSCEKDAGSNES